LEVEFRVRSRSTLNAFLNYALQRTQDLDSRSELTNSPRHLLKAGISLPLASFLHASLRTRFESSRLTLQGNTTDLFTVTDLTLSMGWPSSFAGADHRILRGSRLSLQVRNLFDEAYATPAGFEHRQAAIAQDGRSVFVTLGTAF